jgi:flagellar assembly protein FliH
MSEHAVQSLRLADLQYEDRGFTPLHNNTASSGGFVTSNEAVPVGLEEDDPYARGLADGQHMAAAAFELERIKLQDLIASAQALQTEPSDELAVLIGEAVEMLVTQIVGSAIVDRDLLATRAQQAAAIVAECDAARTMWVHPDDVALLDEDAFAIPLMADPKAERGSIRIDCSAGWIEHGTALYLEQLRIELGLSGDKK